MSGLQVNETLRTYFEEMRLRRKYKYLIFGIEKKGMEGKNIIYDWKFYSHGGSTGSGGGGSSGPIEPGSNVTNGTEQRPQRQGDNRIPMERMNPSSSTVNGTPSTTQGTAEPATQTSTSSSSTTTTGSNGGGSNGSTFDMDNGTAWNMMMKELPRDDGRFILFDYTAKANDGRNIQKIILIKWCPDNANVNTKMLMGSTHETLKRSLTGITKDVQACDTSDIDYKGIADSLVGV